MLNPWCGCAHWNEFHEPVYCALCGEFIGTRCVEAHMTSFVSQSKGCTHIPKGGGYAKDPNETSGASVHLL